MKHNIKTDFCEPGVLVITLKSGKQIIKTIDEMEHEAPGFRGIVTQTNLLNDTEGNPIDQQEVSSWKFQRGWVAQATNSNTTLRVFGDTFRAAYRKMEELLNAKVA